jgi:hypothetical protein
MANFSAADVKRLREQTGAGMLDCKNALAEADGNLEAAVEILRLKGAKDVRRLNAPRRRRGGERPARRGRPARARAHTTPKSPKGRTRKAGAGRRTRPY